MPAARALLRKSATQRAKPCWSDSSSAPAPEGWAAGAGAGAGGTGRRGRPGGRWRGGRRRGGATRQDGSGQRHGGKASKARQGERVSMHPGHFHLRRRPSRPCGLARAPPSEEPERPREIAVIASYDARGLEQCLAGDRHADHRPKRSHPSQGGVTVPAFPERHPDTHPKDHDAEAEHKASLAALDRSHRGAVRAVRGGQGGEEPARRRGSGAARPVAPRGRALERLKRGCAQRAPYVNCSTPSSTAPKRMATRSLR